MVSLESLAYLTNRHRQGPELNALRKAAGSAFKMLGTGGVRCPGPRGGGAARDAQMLVQSGSGYVGGGIGGLGPVYAEQFLTALRQQAANTAQMAAGIERVDGAIRGSLVDAIRENSALLRQVLEVRFPCPTVLSGGRL